MQLKQTTGATFSVCYISKTQLLVKGNAGLCYSGKDNKNTASHQDSGKIDVTSASITLMHLLFAGSDKNSNAILHQIKIQITRPKKMWNLLQKSQKISQKPGSLLKGVSQTSVLSDIQ